MTFRLLASLLIVILSHGSYLYANQDKEQEDKINTPGEPGQLRNPVLIKRFLGTDSQTIPPIEHFSFNALGGLFHGALIGGLGSLAMYKTDDTTATTQGFALIGGSLALTGVIGGVLITFEERSTGTYFKSGANLLEYLWFGTLAGAVTGGIAGAIPYSSSNKTDDLINFTGYGALAGFSTGLIWSLIDLPASLQFDLSVRQTKDSMGLAITQSF